MARSDLASNLPSSVYQVKQNFKISWAEWSIWNHSFSLSFQFLPVLSAWAFIQTKSSSWRVEKQDKLLLLFHRGCQVWRPTCQILSASASYKNQHTYRSPTCGPFLLHQACCLPELGRAPHIKSGVANTVQILLSFFFF